MSIFCSFLFGIVQGLTEFLPISSSGHLVLTQKLFGIEPDLFSTVAVHCGTLVAVVIFYKKQVWQIAKKPLCKKSRLVLVATLPTVVIGFVVKLFLPQILDGVLLPIGFALTFVLLITSNCTKKQQHNLLTLPYKTAFWCGVAQGIAVLPGLSRSGTTICFLKHSGTKNTSATELSFLMSIPVILGSIVLLLPDVVSSGAKIDFLPIVISTATSFVFGYLSLGLLTKIAKTNNFNKFAPYMLFPFLLSCIIF